MSVHYKFKSALDYDTVTFDGLHISVGDLKAAISQQKRIGKTSDFDLQITNAQTKEVYVDDNTLIPKNTSLLVARVPLSQQPKKQWEGSNNSQSSLHKDVSVNKGLADLSRMEGSEQDKINAMISQSTFDYDPSNYQKIRGQNQRGIVPSNYICYKCQKKGHWIKDCPAANSGDPIEIRRSTGIPRSFMVPVDGPKAPGAMMTPSGTFAVPAVDHEAYLASESAGGADTPSNAPVAPEPTIPDELICSLCRDLLTDAVMIPCCGNSFCDECIRGALLESEDHECPDCREKEIAPTTLIPNRFLRNSVSAFRNQTGYSRRAPHRPSVAPPVIEPPPEVQPPNNPVNGPIQPVPGNNVEPGVPDEPGEPGVPSVPGEPGAPGIGEPRERDSRDPRDRRDRRDARNEYGERVGRHNREARYDRDARDGRGGRDSRRPRDRRRRGDESDGSADDNITVTVPPAHAHHVPSYPPERPHLPRYGPSGIKPGIDGPLVNMPRMDEQRASTPTVDERRDPLSSQVMYNRGPPPFMPGLPPPSHFNPNYGRAGPYERFPPEPYQPPPPGIKDSPNGHEDPLEAFNRMIREKEMRAKRREERRRAHPGSRSPTRSRTPRSPRSPRSRSPRSQRSPRSPRLRPRSRASSRIRYSRSRSLSRGRLRRSPWSPRRRRTRERTLSLTRSPSPRRRHRSPMRYRSPLRSPVRSPLHSPMRSPARSPIRPLMSIPVAPPLALSPVRSPRRSDMRSPPRPMSPHRYAGVYDELLSPPRRPVEPPFGARYPSRNIGPPPIYTPISGKPPPMIPPQTEPPSGYRGRFDAPAFEDIPPGVEPPVPGFEPSPFEKTAFGPPGSMERERLIPPNFRDPYRAPYVEGPAGYRDVPGIPPVQNDIPPHVDHPPRYRDNFRPGHSYRDQGPGLFRDGQPFRDPGPQPPYRDGNFRPQPLFRDNNYRNNMFREGHFRENLSHELRDGGVAFRPPSADQRENIPGQYHDNNYRDGYRDDNNSNREGRSGYRSNPRNRPSSRRNPNIEHERNRDGKDRERLNDNREQSDRSERPREVDKRSGYEKGREPRDDRMRDYDRIRDERDKDKAHEKTSPDKKARVSPKRGRDARDRKRSESRGRSRDRENKREKKEEKVRDKTSSDRGRDHKEKDKKIKERKKKKREKEKDIEKKRKRDKKEKKEKDGFKKDDNIEKSDTKRLSKGETNDDFKHQVAVKSDLTETDRLNNISNDLKKSVSNEKSVKDDLYGDEAAEAVDKEIIQNYIKSEEKEDGKILDGGKDEPFDGIELQAVTDELDADIEGTNNNKEMLAPLPALSKWEVDDENVEKSREPGEITSPEEEDGGKVTSEVIKRAENAIFAKAINSLRPIEIKKISNDRLKLYVDDAQQKNNIQITVPVSDQEQKLTDTNDKNKRYSKTPPPRLSVKDRLGGKVEDIRRNREPRHVQSTVERVKSRSKTPKQEQISYRRVTVERDRSRKPEHLSRVEIPKLDRRNPTLGSKSDNYQNDDFKKKDFERKCKDEKKQFSDERKDSKNQQKNNALEKKNLHDIERKKSTLDEAHFVPDYDENVESENESKDDPSKKRERSRDVSPSATSDPKKAKLDTETIKLDLSNVKKKPESDSESSSYSECSSSSSSSGARKRKKKKKRSKKKKKRAASDSDSDSDTSSDEHKKKKKKRKHKKKSSKKKKKYKHK